MDMTGEYRIPAPRQKVWEGLNDPDTLKQCIPGCDEIVKKSDTEMSAKVTAKVGPVKAKFSGDVTLTDVNPPESYTIRGEGKGGAAGFAKGGAKVHLAEDGPDATVLSYEVDAQVGGKLAQIGARLIDGTAKKMADDFFGKFSEVIAGQPAIAEPSSAEPEVVGEPPETPPKPEEVPAPTAAPAPSEPVAATPAPAKPATPDAAPATVGAPDASEKEKSGGIAETVEAKAKQAEDAAARASEKAEASARDAAAKTSAAASDALHKAGESADAAAAKIAETTAGPLNSSQHALDKVETAVQKASGGINPLVFVLGIVAIILVLVGIFG